MSEDAIDDLAHVRALLFDLGGVVIEADFGRAIRLWADRASCDPADLTTRFAFDDAYEQHERGNFDASGYLAALRRSLGVAVSDDDLRAGWNEIYRDPVPGVGAMLTAASRRFPLFAFTNSNPTHQRVWAARFAKELSVFRSVFVSCDVGLRKPDPEAFTTVARRTGFHPSAILFFDDSAENIDGARAAGMSAVLVESASDVRRTLQLLKVEVGGEEVEP